MQIELEPTCERLVITSERGRERAYVQRALGCEWHAREQLDEPPRSRRRILLKN